MEEFLAASIEHEIEKKKKLMRERSMFQSAKPF